MTKKDIIETIGCIKETAKTDYEAAHGLEDSLREEFIKDISKQKNLLGQKAKLVLSTNSIDFPRYTA